MNGTWSKANQIFIKPIVLTWLMGCCVPLWGNTTLLLGPGLSRSLKVPNLKRVAVGNKKVASVRGVPPDSVWVTGKSPGRTTLQVWDTQGTERTFEVEVVPSEVIKGSSLGTGGKVVKVDLSFVEVDASRAREVGLRLPEYLQASAGGSVSSYSSGINYVVSLKSGRAWWNQMEQSGGARMLAKPTLFVRLGEEVKFHSGGEIPVINAVESGISVTQKIDWKAHGLKVKIRPQSADDFMITTDVSIELSELVPRVDGEGIPALHSRSLETKMVSREGQMVILTGLVKQLSHQESSGIPLLGDIPLLGILFAKKSRGEQRNEIIMGMKIEFPTKNDEADQLNHLEELERFD